MRGICYEDDEPSRALPLKANVRGEMMTLSNKAE
jgi:hypothetical protein